MRPIEFDAHIELGGGRAAEYQPLPFRQPGLRRGQGESIDLVSCGKGRADTGVSRQPIVLLRLQTLSLSLCTYSPSLAEFSPTSSVSPPHTHTHKQNPALRHSFSNT